MVAAFPLGAGLVRSFVFLVAWSSFLVESVPLVEAVPTELAEDVVSASLEGASVWSRYSLASLRASRVFDLLDLLGAHGSLAPPHLLARREILGDAVYCLPEL